MKCLSPDEMEWYVARYGDETAECQEQANHITNCPHCSALHKERVEEQTQWSKELFTRGLPESFTDQVMNALEDVEIEPIETIPSTERDCVERTVEQGRAVQQEPAPALRWKRKRTWRIAVAVASLVILMSAAVVYSVPTLAEKIRSLFTRSNVDIGLLRAQEFGLIQHPNIKVRDKGYTVKIDEAVGDPTRIIVALQLFGPDGKHDRDRLVLNGENQIKIKDEQGHEVGEMYDMGATSDFYYLVAFFPEPLQADRITVEGQIRQLGNDMRNLPFIQGGWDFKFPIDMTEAKKKTTFASLTGQYTSPDGMTVRLKRLTRMVQGVRLELDTELSEAALARSPGDLWQKQQLSFHFEDLQGEEIHSVNTRKMPSMDSVMTRSAIPGDRPGVMHWSYTFTYLPEEQPYRFVLDGYFIAERDGASVEFEPAKLKERPVPFRFQGDELMLKDFTVEQPPNTNSPGAEGTLHIDGTLWNDFHTSEWTLQDTAGQDHAITMRGVSSARGSNWKDGVITLGNGGMPGELFEFRSADLVHIPERLTLIRTVIDKRYTNVDWSVLVDEASGRREGGGS